MGLGLVVIRGISSGVNGVDQLRLDMASRMPGGIEPGKCFLFSQFFFFTTAALESPAGEVGEVKKCSSVLFPPKTPFL